jgi:hypothetical protein
VRSGGGGMEAGLRLSSVGLRGWWDVVVGFVVAFGNVRCGMWLVERGVLWGVGVVCVVGHDVGGA